MSPLYVPRKRKSVQSQPKSGVPCPGTETLRHMHLHHLHHHGLFFILNLIQFQFLQQSSSEFQTEPVDQMQCDTLRCCKCSMHPAASVSARMLCYAVFPPSCCSCGRLTQNLSTFCSRLDLHSSVLECFRKMSLMPKTL